MRRPQLDERRAEAVKSLLHGTPPEAEACLRGLAYRFEKNTLAIRRTQPPVGAKKSLASYGEPMGAATPLAYRVRRSPRDASGFRAATTTRHTTFFSTPIRISAAYYRAIVAATRYLETPRILLISRLIFSVSLGFIFEDARITGLRAMQASSD